MNDANQFDGGDDEQELNERLAKDQENARKTAIEDIRWMMSSPRGRRIVWWLLAEAGVYRSSYPCDANMAFREGGRNLGLQLQAKVTDHCPDSYITMLNEMKAK